MRILFAPLHYVLDARNSGSEFSWAYEIYRRLSRKDNILPTFVTGGVRGVEDQNLVDCQVFNPQKVDLSLKNVLMFYLKVYLSSKKISQLRDFEVFHHVLPFYIGKSFNLWALSSRKKFVLGPIQSPLAVVDKDLTTKSARGFEKSKFSVAQKLDSLFVFLTKPILSFLSARTLKKADKIIAINRRTKDLLSSRGIAPEKIKIIPLGIDVLKFNPIPFSKKESQTIELITTGILLKRKGVELTIKALNEVLKVDKRVRLRIVGDGPQMGFLKKEAERLKINEYVIFQGFVPYEGIQKYYQNAHIFVSMSRAESWGQMYLEAMACGLPVITTNNVGSNEIVLRGESGYLVEQEDYQQLAEKVIYLIKNPILMAEFGSKARQVVEERYDWDKIIIPEYLNLYESLFR